MSMDRRTFFGVSLGAGAIYGIDALVGQERASAGAGQGGSRRPAAYEQALAEMKRSGRAGLVFVVPGDAKQRKLLAQFLYELIEIETPYYPMHGIMRQIDSADHKAKNARFAAFQKQWRRDARDLRACVVLICLTPEEAGKLFSPGENRILLDPLGREIARIRVDANKLEPGPLRQLADFLRGDRLAHLRRIASTTSKGLGDDVRSVVDSSLRVATTRAGSRVSAATLRSHSSTIGPMLLLARERATDERVRTRMENLMDHGSSRRESKLPYGATMPDFECHGCGGFSEVKPGKKKGARAIAVACGMALPTAAGRKYLRFAKK